MVSIIDYDAGNLRSVEQAFALLGEETKITRNREEILGADRIVLPGVGAFGDAMKKLQQYELIEVVREAAASGKPFLGICLGLQLLFEASEESPGVPGLGICKGEILRIPAVSDHPKLDGATYLKIPHMGWNSLRYDHPGRLFAGIPEESYVYFVHSYYLKAREAELVTASTHYAVDIHASIEEGNVFACQFHPEKSGRVGLAMLKNFTQI